MAELEVSGESGGLTELPEEVLEQIFCCPLLSHVDVVSACLACKKLQEVCQGRSAVWKHQFRRRWPTLLKYYNTAGSHNWWEEYRTRHSIGRQVQTMLDTFSKQFFTKEVPVDGFKDIEALGGPFCFIEDELLSILNKDGRKYLTWKYYSRKILCYLRQRDIMEKLKMFLLTPSQRQTLIEGVVLIDQYCNPLADNSLENILLQLNSITDEVKKVLHVTHSSHPSITAGRDDVFIDDLETQQQVLDAMNRVLYKQLKFKGNEEDYYNPMNSYIHQVLSQKKGIPITLCVIYSTIGKNLGVRLEPVSFPSHFLLRWCQKPEGSTDILDYVYVDAFNNGKPHTAKECAHLIGQQVTSKFYNSVTPKDVLFRMVTNLFHLGKREGSDQSYQLLRNALDLYLTLSPDDVRYLMLQARLYFHLGINPEKVLDILQHIQAVDPLQHGVVGHLVQLTLEQIARKTQTTQVQVKRHTDEKHRKIQFSVGLIMKHKRYGYDCVIYGWDPKCTMGLDWMRTMGVHNLPHGPDQPFYNVLVQDGSCRYAAQENLICHASPLEIGHEEVGRYFSDFSGTHYIANEELQNQYPDDMELTSQLVEKVYGRS
ncbi:F-box only protein 21 isoform X1 [Chiloscyllium plagiosum]|uniref:F-box only protein 21 isoform X1 n=1 Tax=Chiloscyllium plagiosum TaxID=36176 RepID=UPI001CB80348|nr:F-box only protein 21 isoform X1 [Chiloscyllium plagiosum]